MRQNQASTGPRSSPVKAARMCGISGVFGHSQPEIVEGMLSTLVHRGPDDGHIVTGPDFTIGTRRLAIVDPSGGKQPLDGPLVVALNGEIYNYREPGARPGASDTSVIPLVYNSQFPTQLEGMFAIALWDKRHRQGLLVRDRAGKKPLYYTEIAGKLWFASEIKALLSLPDFRREICPEALHHYLSLGYVPPPLSIFRGIRSLPPAHTLLWKEGAIREIRPYWRLDWSPAEENLSEAEAAEELLHLLKQAVARRRHTPESFFLSGGVDSSFVTALAAQNSHEPLHTYTLGYAAGEGTPGHTLDVECAQETAERYYTRHTLVTMEAGLFRQNLARTLTHFDEPFACGFAIYYLAPHLRQHAKVALTGDGADELFGSYDTHRIAGALLEFEQGHAPALFEGREASLMLLSRKTEAERHAVTFTWTEAEKAALYREPTACSTLDWLSASYQDLTARDGLNRHLEVDFQIRLAGMILPLTDRLTMAHGLEARSPFLDTAVMEFAAKLPPHYKIRGLETKALLKQTARGHVPASCLDRKKQGFQLPANRWLSGQMLEDTQKILSLERLAKHGLFKAEIVEQQMERLITR